MTRTIIKTIIILFFTQLSVSQTVNKIDSLVVEYQKVKHNNLDKALKLISKADSISSLLSTNKDKTEINYYLSEIYYLLKNYNTSKYHADLALKLIQTDNNILKSKIYNSLSILERKNGNVSKAFKFYEEAKKAALIDKDKTFIENILFNGYYLYDNRGDKVQAKKLLKEAMYISKKKNNTSLLAQIYNAKGYANRKINNDSLLKYYKLSIKNAKLSNNKLIESTVKLNLGDFYLNIKNLPFAYKNLQEGKLLAEQAGNNVSLFYANFYLGRYYEFMEDYSKVFYHYDMALNTYGKYVAKEYKRNAYYLIAGAYEHVNNFEKAFEYQTKYIEINKKIKQVQKAKEFDKIRTQYNVKEKNNQISLLEKENEIKATKQKWLIISSIILILPLILLFLFYRHRAIAQRKIRNQEKEIHTKETQRLQKEQELVAIKALIEGQDKERHRIAKELHDGVGGQLASVNMGLSHINSNLNNTEITALGNTLSKTFNELRVLSHSLSSNYHKERTLNSLIGELKLQYENSSAFNIEVSIFPENCLNNLEANIKHNFYRILQELLTNCTKYANASLVQVSFNLHETVLVMLYEDNGNGFDIEQEKKGVGLKNIEERVQAINGKIIIESTPNIGTQIIIETPIK